MPLTHLGDLKAYLGVTDTSEDTYLQILQVGTEEAFKGLVGYAIEQNTYTEYLDGNWTSKIALRQNPVSNVASVNIDNNGYYGSNANGFGASTLLVAGQDYYLQNDRSEGGSLSGILVRIANVWPGMMQKLRGDLTASKVFGQGNIKVVYTAGYKIIPADVQQAIFEACKELRFRRKRMGPINSEHLGEYGYTAALMPIDYRMALLRVGSMEQIVARYRRLRLQ